MTPHEVFRPGGRRAFPRAGAVLAAAVLLTAGAATRPTAASGEAARPELPKTGEVTVRVTFPDGTAAAGASVTVGGKLITADDRGVAKAAAIPVKSGVASGDTIRKTGGILGLFGRSTRYLGYAPLSLQAGAPADVRVVLAPVASVETACRACHPDKRTPERPVSRCAHKSGVPLKPEEEARVRQFNKENDALRKAGKSAYAPIPFDVRETEGSARAILVCESCHSNHVETGYRAYVTMPFETQSVLCRGCHV